MASGIQVMKKSLITSKGVNFMAGNFFGGQFTTPSIQVIPVTSREIVDSYPVAPGATVVFLNYKDRRLYIKDQSTNVFNCNIEEFILVKPEEYANQNQNGKYVTEEMFTALCNTVQDLRRQFEEFIK